MILITRINSTLHDTKAVTTYAYRHPIAGEPCLSHAGFPLSEADADLIHELLQENITIWTVFDDCSAEIDCNKMSIFTLTK